MERIGENKMVRRVRNKLEIRGKKDGKKEEKKSNSPWKTLRRPSTTEYESSQ